MRADEFCKNVTARFTTAKNFMSTDAGESNHSLISAAVLFGIFDKSSEAHLLLTERSQHLPDHAGEVALPGGKVNNNETFTQAALREANEEVGLDSTQAKVIGNLGAYHSRSNYAIVPVISRLQDDIEFSANPAEVENIFSVPLSFLFDESNHIHREINGRSIYSMPWQDEDRVWHIWGVTAGIIRMVCNRIYGDENVQ